MATKRTGTAQGFNRADGTRFYRGRIRLADGSRPWLRAEYATKADAERAAGRAQELEDERGAILAAKQDHAPVNIAMAASDPSVGKLWFDGWEAARLARGLTSTRDNRSHYERHILPAMKGKP